MKKLMITLLCAAFGGAQVLFSTEVKFVDYVESTGSQAVDLGIVGRSGMRVTTRMSWVTVPSDGGYIGARNGSTRFYPVYCYPSKWDIGYKDNYGGSTPVAGTIYDVVSVLKKGEQTLTVNGVANITQAVDAEYNSGLNLYLFGINYSGGKYCSKARCYSLMIETNTVDNGWVKVMDLRPVAIESEGALYDVVSGRIFRSATATPLVASKTAVRVANVEHQEMTAEGTVDFLISVDGKFTPCAISAVVSNAVTGTTTTKSLGVAEDSDVHAYRLSDLSPDGKYVVAIRGIWPGEGGETCETDLATMTVCQLAVRAMALRDSLIIRFAGNVPGNQLRMAYGAMDAGDDPDDWGATVDCGTLQADEGYQNIPFPTGWGDTVRAARFFITDEDGSDIAARSDTVAPAEDKSFSSLSYVTNGLIAQWDAIENAGRGVHSDKPTAWTELVGGRTVSKSANLSYGKTFVKFDGSKDRYFTCNIPALKTALANKSCTVEMQLRPTEYVKFGGIFMVGTSSARELILDQREEVGSGSAKCAFGGLQYAASGWSSITDCCPPANDYFGKDVMATVTVDGNGAHLAYDGGEIVHTNPGKGVAPTSDLLTVGMYGGNSPAKMYVRSVRIYDTALTREQSQWNLFVDRVRFCTQSAFNYSKGQDTLTFSMDCPSPVPYDVVAVVRDLGDDWTTVTNVVAEGVVTGPVSVAIPGVDPTGSYEVVVRIRVPVDGEVVESDVNILTMVAPESVETPGTIYQTAAVASPDDSSDWLLPASGLRRTPVAGDSVFIGSEPGDYLLRLSGANDSMENMSTFGGVTELDVSERIEILDGARVSTTSGFTLGASGAGLKTKAELFISGGKLDVGGKKFIGTNSDGSGKDSTASIRIENGGELCLDRVTTTYVASLQLTGKEPVDFMISTGGVLRANYTADHYFSVWKESFHPSSGWPAGGGAGVTFTVDGGRIVGTNLNFYTQGAYIFMKGGSWYSKSVGITTSTRSGRLTVSGGDMTLTGSISLYCGANDGIYVSGGSLNVKGSIACQCGERLIQVSGGKFATPTLSFSYASDAKGRSAFRVFGSTADLTVDVVNAGVSGADIMTPIFWDYRFDSTARPGGPGVAPRKKTASNTTVHGHYRISPYGGFQLVSTNVFPLVVHTDSTKTLVAGTAARAKLGTTFHTDLWDFSLAGPTFAAALKEDAALVDGRTYAEGRVRGYLQLPSVGNPKHCLGATVRMNVVPQGTKTLDNIVSDIAGQYPGAAKVEGEGYNVEIPLPLERLGRGKANRAVFDFSTITTYAAAEAGTITTNALVTAIAAEVKKPGLIISVH